MILSAKTLRRLQPVSPFCERTVRRGMSYGLSIAGYDVRVNLTELQPMMRPGVGRAISPQFGPGVYLERGAFLLVSTLEQFHMPNNAVGFVLNKSTWARRGLVVQSSVIEPGWSGYLTIALHSLENAVSIFDGDPIAQIVFHKLDEDDGPGYAGKYQNQGPEPTPARLE